MRTVKRILAVLLALTLPGLSYATVGTGTVWWVQTTAPAGNTSGGGFDRGASFDNTLSCTSANTSAPVCTSSNYTFVAGDAGYSLYVSTNAPAGWTPGWYPIASVSGGAATLSADVGQALQMDFTKGSPYTMFQANTVSGVATSASPTSGVWGIDYSKSDTRVINAVADLTIDATVNTKVTSASRTFGVNDIGNMIHISAGTSWTLSYYDITSVSSGAATLDRSPSAAGNANKGTWYYGAASSLGSNTAGRTDAIVAAASSAGNRVFIKAGSYTVSAAYTFTAGTANNPTIIEGYNTTPGDAPTGSSRPTLSLGANVLTVGTGNQIFNVIALGSSTNVLIVGTSGAAVNCKAFNSSTTAGRNAISAIVANGHVLSNEAVSYRGIGIARGSAAFAILDGNYIHDSDVGIKSTGGSITEVLIFNIIADNVTAGYQSTTGVTGGTLIRYNTFYGAENQLGTALIFPTNTTVIRALGNVFYGFSTGLSAVDTSNANFLDYNDYFNNAADFNSASIYQYGPHDKTVNPTFTSMGQYTGTNASVSGSVLTDSGANFANTTDNVDFLYISNGGAGPSTVGKYMITAHTSTTLTVDIAPGNSASGVVYQTTYGHNFAIGTNLKAQGFPGPFPGGLTTGYLDIGAVQRQETGGTGGTHAWTWSN